MRPTECNVFNVNLLKEGNKILTSMTAIAHSRSRGRVVNNILFLFTPSICGCAYEVNVVIKQIHYIENKHW